MKLMAFLELIVVPVLSVVAALLVAAAAVTVVFFGAYYVCRLIVWATGSKDWMYLMFLLIAIEPLVTLMGFGGGFAGSWTIFSYVVDWVGKAPGRRGFPVVEKVEKKDEGDREDSAAE